MSELTIVAVQIEDREDGGLRVYSEDLPNLILSGRDKETVVSNIVPAIEAIFRHKGFSGVRVRPARAISDVLKVSGRRDVDVHIHHEQFVVELPNAA